jgi:hypothetical protein
MWKGSYNHLNGITECSIQQRANCLPGAGGEFVGSEASQHSKRYNRYDIKKKDGSWIPFENSGYNA